METRSALEQYITAGFGVVEPSDLQTIASLFKPALIKKGDFVLRAGKPCDQMSFVRSGLLRMFVSTGDKEITQWITSKNNFSADLSSFLSGAPSRSSIQALADTEVSAISKADYQRIGELVPQWHELEKLFTLRCFITLEERIFSHLSMTAEDRYENLFAQQRELFNQVPLQYLASFLGMTPETFSRIRKKQLS